MAGAVVSRPQQGRFHWPHQVKRCFFGKKSRYFFPTRCHRFQNAHKGLVEKSRDIGSVMVAGQMWKNPVFAGVLAGMPTKLMYEFEAFTTMKIPFSYGNASFAYMNAPFTYQNASNIAINGAMKDEFGANAYQNGLNASINVPIVYEKSTKSRGNEAFIYMTEPNRVVNGSLMDAFASFTSMADLFSIIKIVAKLSIDVGKQRFEAKIRVTVSPA